MFKNLLLAVVFTVVAFGSVFAYELRDPSVYDFTDVQMWYSNGDGPQKLATGACYGPVKEVVNDRGVKLGDLGRACSMITYDAVNSKSEESVSGGLAVNLFSVMGITGSLFQDPFNGDWNWGMGVSVMDVMRMMNGTKQLEKVRQLSFHDSSVLPVFYSDEPLDKDVMSGLVDQLDIDFVRIVR